MSVSSTSSTSTSGSINYTSTSASKSSGLTVDTETFLTLLVAQLKYQDPLEPQDNTAFVTQLAQMSSLSQMQDMSATLQNSQAYDMIGKEIYAGVLDSDTGETTYYTGVVDSVVINSGIPYLVVGNTAIRVSDVLQVVNSTTTDTSTTDSSSSTTEVTA